MDQRYNPRLPVCVNVVMHCTGNNLVSGRTLNVSLGGMLVELTPGTDFEQDAAVRLAFSTGKGIKIIPTIVVQQSKNTFGLKFTKNDPDTIKAVERLLNDWSNEPAAQPVPRYASM
jgi:hypothetical protein